MDHKSDTSTPSPSLSQEDKEKLRFFVKTATGCFAKTAARYVAVSLKQQDARKARDEFLQLVKLGVVGSI